MAKTKPDSSKPVTTAATDPDQTNDGASQQSGDTSTSTAQDGVATGTTDAATIAAGTVSADPAPLPASAATSETQPQPVAGTKAISFPIADEDTDRARAALADGLRSLGIDVELLQGNTSGTDEQVEARRFEALKPVRHNNVFYPIGRRLRVTREEHAELAGAGVVDPDWDEDED